MDVHSYALYLFTYVAKHSSHGTFVYHFSLSDHYGLTIGGSYIGGSYKLDIHVEDKDIAALLLDIN